MLMVCHVFRQGGTGFAASGVDLRAKEARPVMQVWDGVGSEDCRTLSQSLCTCSLWFCGVQRVKYFCNVLLQMCRKLFIYFEGLCRLLCILFLFPYVSDNWFAFSFIDVLSFLWNIQFPLRCPFLFNRLIVASLTVSRRQIPCYFVLFQGHFCNNMTRNDTATTNVCLGGGVE